MTNPPQFLSRTGFRPVPTPPPSGGWRGVLTGFSTDWVNSTGNVDFAPFDTVLAGDPALLGLVYPSNGLIVPAGAALIRLVFSLRISAGTLSGVDFFVGVLGSIQGIAFPLVFDVSVSGDGDFCFCSPAIVTSPGENWFLDAGTGSVPFTVSKAYTAFEMQILG